MNRPLSHTIAATALALSAVMTAFADGSDVSNRCSLTSARLLCPALDASFESGLEACRPRTVSKTFDRALDLSE